MWINRGKINKLRIVSLVLFIGMIFQLLMPITGSTAQLDQSELQDKLIKSMSFYVGKVTRSYVQSGQSSLWSTDLTQYIDTDQKTIRSETDELLWDYATGILKINTPKTQGASGYLNKTTAINLNDIVIKSNNEYATVVVTSLDNSPIKTSQKIMIQCMTEDKFYGATTVNGKITNLGSAPLNVKNIDVTVTLKGLASMKNIVVLDENGYGKTIMPKTVINNDLEIKLEPNAVYTVVTNNDQTISNPYQAGSMDYVWWEAESSTNTNFPKNSWFSTSTDGKWELLSGGNWLSSSGNRTIGQPELKAGYSIDVPADGEYDLWVRKFWNHGPFKWRFGQNEWTNVGTNMSLADNVGLRTYVSANWVNLGKTNLTKGTQSFEFNLTAKEGEALTSGMDCFMLTPKAFVPRGNLKPGAKTGLTESGYWSFEPPADPFNDALLDLRNLNEQFAGQSGFVKKSGENFLLGDGTPVKFWAVNATANQDKKSIDYMARRLAKYGVNMVRFHGPVFNSKSSDLSTVDSAALDKLHYFVYAMKSQGIYVNISSYFPLWLELSPNQGIPGYETIANKRPFTLLMFDKQFQGIYKSWLTSMMSTINPYTNVPLSQEPGVAIIELQNEDSYFFWTFTKDNIPDVQLKKLEILFGNWLIAKYGTMQNALTNWGSGSGQARDNISESRMTLLDAWNMTRDGAGSGSKRKRMSDQVQFLTENQKKFYEDMVKFLREDIKTQSLISASNWTTADNVNLDPLERYTYTATDVIDRHGYFECNHKGEGASYSVRVDDTYSDVSVMHNPESAITQVIQAENYPHMITETAWTNPSKYKGESVPMWATYGALQGMDAIHFFAVGTGDWEATTSKWPVMIPSVLSQFPVFALMYRRGDVREAQKVIKITQSLTDLYDFKGSAVYENQALDILRSIPSPTPSPMTTPIPTPTPTLRPTLSPTPTPLTTLEPTQKPTPIPVQKRLSIKFNNTTIKLLSAKLVSGNHVITSAKEVSKLLRATYKWDAKKKLIYINKGKTKIILKINSTFAKVNAKIERILPKPSIEKGVPYVSLQFISKKLGYNYKFDSKSRIADINKKK